MNDNFRGKHLKSVRKIKGCNFKRPMDNSNAVEIWASEVFRNKGKHCKKCNALSLVQFSPSVVSDSLQPHESQHTRSLCLSPTPGAYSNSCPLSW